MAERPPRSDLAAPGCRLPGRRKTSGRDGGRVPFFLARPADVPPDPAPPESTPPISRLLAAARGTVISFAPGSGASLESMAASSGADVLGIDWQTTAAVARRVASAHGKAMQGNLIRARCS